jgi:proton-dependent oligopeptide transporter, POT family
MVPIFDYVVYPTLRKFHIDFTPIKRIYAGFLMLGLAMIYASVLQSYIGDPFLDTEEQQANINVWVVLIPYLMVGIAEILASVTAVEYAFTKAPLRMKSVVMAFSQFQQAFAAAINYAFTETSAGQNLTWLYGSFAIVAWVIGTIFFFTYVFSLSLDWDVFG